MADHPDSAGAAQKLLDQRARINDLAAEVAYLRTGEEDGYNPLVRPTPGQWLKQFNSSPIPERLAIVARVLDACTRASTCFELNHEARLKQLQDDYATIARWRNEQADRADQAEAEAEGHKRDYLNACKTIADMHAAAVGRGDRGPSRGVVEDVEDVRLRAEQAEAKVDEATAVLRRVRSQLATLKEQGATGQAYYRAITDALAGPRPDGTEQLTS